MNEIEKLAYLKSLVYIATIDEKFDVREKQYILNIANMFGLNKEQSEELIITVMDRKENVEDILSGITERKTKLLLIYDLITLSYADENYCDKEKAEIVNIGKILNIENGKISEIENLFDESIKLQEKINKALER